MAQILIEMLYLTLLFAPAAADTRLSTAAMKGDKVAVQSLLRQNANVNAAQGDGTTALHWAAFRDDLEMAQLLIKAGADVKARTRLGDLTPLFMAAKNGNAAMLQLLLKAGSDAKAATTTGTTPLMQAAASGSVDAVKVLLDNGVDVNAKDINQGQTALMFAAALNNADVIKLLSAHGADVNATSLVPDRLRREPPQNAQNANRPQNARRGGARENILALGGMTALQFAARDGQKAAVDALVAAGADVNVLTASDKMSTLTIAILNGQFDIAKFLLDHGADPKPANATGITALFAVIDAQWANRVWYPPPNVEQEKTTHLDLIKEILARGADPNAKIATKLWHRQFHGDWIDSAGATPFWRAAQANDVPAMKLLAAGGADPTIPSQHLCSPLQVAAGFGLEPQVSTFVPDARLAAVRYLVDELGADLNSKDDRGYTPLHAAALTGDNQLIRYMVAKGADVKARANMRFGRADNANEEAPAGTGDTVADMANGPRERNLVYPETLALLVKLGSENSDNCRAATCVQKASPPKQR